MNEHVMIDLETLGTAHNSVIVQIAAIDFDFNSESSLVHINRGVTIDSCLNKGLIVDEGAINFWLNQPKKPFLEIDSMPLEFALDQFSRRFNWKKIKGVWSHSSFDAPILNSAFKACGIKMPFSYRTVFDIRTVFYLAGINTTDWNESIDGIKHDAFSDARFQIKLLKEAMNVINFNVIKNKI